MGMLSLMRQGVRWGELIAYGPIRQWPVDLPQTDQQRLRSAYAAAAKSKKPACFDAGRY